MAEHSRQPPTGPAAHERWDLEAPDHDVIVDGTIITAQEIAAEMHHHPAETPAASWKAAAKALVIRQLLENAAAAQGLDPREEDSFDTLLFGAVTMPEVDEEAARQWYADHPERFGTPELWEASHILIAADPEDEEVFARARRQAEAILAKVQADPQQFPALARLHSDCPSRGTGGHLGQLARGTAMPELTTPLARLHNGEIYPAVVTSRTGMHVLQLHAHTPAALPPFEDIASRVAADLRAQSWQEGVRDYIAALASRARIEGFAFERAPAAPMVQ